MARLTELSNFYKGKRVFITGHTGFKGSWLCKILDYFGAEVYGYALAPKTEPNLFSVSGIQNEMTSVIGDIRDFDNLNRVFSEFHPEIVFHLAAQPIVLESYEKPKYTYETNVMGTVNLLECVRQSDCVKSFLNVTTDKVYENSDDNRAFSEDDKLDGYDPYSNSKSCSELVTHSYTKSFFSAKSIAVSTARAGNVIGGGDFSDNRIIPDCVRAASSGETIIIRNPYSTRPFQFVLDPLFAYLLIAKEQYFDITKQGSYNIGPDKSGCITTGEIADLFCKCWGDKANWKNVCKDTPHEAGFLRLDCSKIKSKLNWHPIWNIEKAVEETVVFSKAFYSGADISAVMLNQIKEFTGESNV